MRYRYRTDEELKDSGVEWIGKIPKDYKLEPLKKYFMFEKGRNAGIYTAEYVGKNEGKYPVYSGQTENEGIMGLIDSYEYDLKQCLFTTTVGAKVMTVLYLTGKFTLSQNCLIMINNMNNVCTKYAYYYLQELFRYEKSLIPLYMQPSLRIEDLKRYKILIQNLREQEKIANFLDKKTSQFDSIISKKEKLIEKLEEAKKSLISEVVIGKVKVVKTDDGYELVKRKSDEMKDSGVEWLGYIPKDWEVRPLYTNFIENKLKNKDNLESNVLSLSYGKIKRRNIESNLGLLPESFNSYQVVNSGNIIFRLTDLQNDKKSLRVGLVEERGIITSAYVGLKVLTGIEKYFYYLFHYYDLKKLYYNLGAGVRQSMGFSDLKKLIYINPNTDEQTQIVNCLDFIIKKYDTVIYKSKKQIEKLKEAKQSLISEAVTGKIEILD